MGLFPGAPLRQLVHDEEEEDHVGADVEHRVETHAENESANLPGFCHVACKLLLDVHQSREADGHKDYAHQQVHEKGQEDKQPQADIIGISRVAEARQLVTVDQLQGEYQNDLYGWNPPRQNMVEHPHFFHRLFAPLQRRGQKPGEGEYDPPHTRRHLEEVNNHKQDDTACRLVRRLAVGQMLEHEAGAKSFVSHKDLIWAGKSLVLFAGKLRDGSHNVHHGDHQVTERDENDWPLWVVEATSVDEKSSDSEQSEKNTDYGKNQDENWSNHVAFQSTKIEAGTIDAAVADTAKSVALVVE